MSKRKTRKQKEKSQLRRQVEALKAELKVYKVEEKTPDKKRKEVVEKKGVKPETLEVKSYIKRDLRKSVVASIISIAILVAAYFFLDDLIQKVFHYNIAG